MIYECANAYYFQHINAIGGIESHLYYIARKYGDYDLTVFYRTGDNKNVSKIRKYVRCIKINSSDRVICENLFCCFNREILDQVTAKKKYLVLHGDYKDMVKRKQLDRALLPIDSRIDKYLGVSQLVCDSWKEITGIEAENVYEPIVLNDCDKPLLFISATRLTREKGWERMKALAKELNKNGVNYLWFIFTNQKETPEENMYFLPQRLDITDKLEIADGFIQLSDNEGFCLSVVEALMRKVPVIASDLPVFKELGINQENSIIIKDINKIPVDEIKNIRNKKFTYKPPKDNWDKVLSKKKSTYKEEFVRVKATIQFQLRSLIDSELGRIPKKGDVWEIHKDRLKTYLDYEIVHKCKLVEVVNETNNNNTRLQSTNISNKGVTIHTRKR